MTEYDDTNTIVLFKNDKEGNDNRPVLTGKVNVRGEEFEVALWGRTANSSGQKFWSGQIKEPGAGGSSTANNGSDDIPFARKPIPDMEHGPRVRRDLFTRSPDAA